LLGKIWLKHEADLLSVSSAEFQDTMNHDCMVHKHVYAVDKNGHNTGWRERENQQNATNLMFIIQLLSQHVSGIIMSIIRRTRLCTTSCGLLHWLCCCGCMYLGCGLCAPCESYCSYSNFRTVHTARVPAAHNQCRTIHAVVHGLGLLMMGKMMPETCWDRRGIINIKLVASCWFSLSLHPVLWPLFSTAYTCLWTIQSWFLVSWNSVLHTDKRSASCFRQIFPSKSPP
jgi:hypothetical protein